MAGFVVEIVEGRDPGRQFPLTAALEIGRDPRLSLPLEDEQVSRRHARIGVSNGRVVVEDLGSTNGTYVNDQPIHGERRITAGGRVRTGLTVLELRTAQQVATQPSAVRPVPSVTVVETSVLQPVPEHELPASHPATQALPSFLVEEAEPAFVPPELVDDTDARTEYGALAALVDTRVKRQTHIALFAVLAIAGLAVLIYFGVR